MMKLTFCVQRMCKFCAVLFFFFNSTNSLQLKVVNKSNKENRRLLARSRTKRETNETFGNDYLLKYGYMPPSSLQSYGHEAGQISWRKALMEMQHFFGLNVTGELDSETLELMHKPRCGNLDKVQINTNLKRKRRYVNVGSKWQSMVVTYSINNYTPKLGKELTHEAINDAFAVWSKHIPLEFKKVLPGDNPDIVTFFAELYHNDNTAFDGVGGYLAHAYYPGRGIGGDTHFDGAEPWTLHKGAYQESFVDELGLYLASGDSPNQKAFMAPVNKYNDTKNFELSQDDIFGIQSVYGNDLFLVAVHELGHALGLGHSPNQKAIMAPVYKYHDTKNFELPQDDIFGIQSIYGKRNVKPEVPIIPTTTTAQKLEKNTKFFPFRTKIYKGKPIHTTTLEPLLTTTKSLEPDICRLTHYDAVSFIRGELYIFSGKYLWRGKRKDFRMQGPFKITSFWTDLKNGVNAAYENPRTKQIVFFKDHMYWEYNGVSLQENSPRPVRFLGLQNDHIGAAVWWMRNGKTYFFQGSHYWRFSGRKVEARYPKPISVWKGIPASVDAAFTGLHEDGKNHTYFVKGTNYWKFNNWDVKAVSGPRSFPEDWLGCGFIERKESVMPKTYYSLNGVIVAVIASLVGVASGLVVIFLKKRRKQEDEHRARVSIAKSPTSPYRLGYSDMSPDNRKRTPREKLMCVSAAQQKIRWFRWSLQEKV